MTTLDAFEPLRAALQKAKTRYAVGGAWASIAFGTLRFTSNIDILVEFNLKNLPEFLRALPNTFYADSDDALASFKLGSSFNVIYMPSAVKFDLFPAHAFPIGQQELDRAIEVKGTGLSQSTARFVTPEDILLAKLYWFKAGGESSEVQWRDILGLINGGADSLDRSYLEENAHTLGVSHLLARAFSNS